MAPTAARRDKLVQRNSFQGLRGNPDACRPRRGVVGPSYGSFAFGQARKLIPSAGPPLPTEPASLGFGGGPSYRKRQPMGRAAMPARSLPCPYSPPPPTAPVWGAGVEGAGGAFDENPCEASFLKRRKAPRPFFSPISSGRNGGTRRVGGAGGASDKNPAKPPSKKRRVPRGGTLHERATTGRPYGRRAESSRPTGQAGG